MQNNTCKQSVYHSTQPTFTASSGFITIGTHITAISVACVVAAIAFGFPSKPDESAFSFTPPVALESKLEVALPLPEAGEVTLFDAEAPLFQNDWTTATVRPGDNLSRIFDRLGLQADDLYSLMACCSEAKSLDKLKPGEILKVRLNEGGQLAEFVFASEQEQALRIFRDGNGFKAGKYRHVIEKRPTFASATVRNSFSEDARAAGLSERLLKQLRHILKPRIDLDSDPHRGAAFIILYEEDYFSGEKIGDGDILAVDLTTREGQYRVVGYRDPNGEMHYYTPKGESLRPAFLRYPVRYQKITSRFSLSRRHPVLGIRRPHKGVDYAAPSGTPIRAVGDGVVNKIGWQSGFGKTIELDHGRGYTSLYAHMSRFNKDLTEGETVQRGQVIGYVGRTGMATGTHLHFEFHSNGRPLDPLNATLPGTPPLQGQQLARFTQQIQPLLAQLDLHQRTRLALSHAASPLQ